MNSCHKCCIAVRFSCWTNEWQTMQTSWTYKYTFNAKKMKKQISSFIWKRYTGVFLPYISNDFHFIAHMKCFRNYLLLYSLFRTSVRHFFSLFFGFLLLLFQLSIIPLHSCTRLWLCNSWHWRAIHRNFETKINILKKVNKWYAHSCSMVAMTKIRTKFWSCNGMMTHEYFITVAYVCHTILGSIFECYFACTCYVLTISSIKYVSIVAACVCVSIWL